MEETTNCRRNFIVFSINILNVKNVSKFGTQILRFFSSVYKGLGMWQRRIYCLCDRALALVLWFLRSMKLGKFQITGFRNLRKRHGRDWASTTQSY